MKIKNKKQKQERQRKAHLALLQVQKKKRGDHLERKQPSIEEVKKPAVLIVCEGEKTEPSYFNQFRVRNADITALGEGYDTESLVQRTYEMVQHALSKGKITIRYGVFLIRMMWIMPNLSERLYWRKAIDYQIAYSNQAFEYWLFLHFNDHPGGQLARRDCCWKFNAHLKEHSCSYDYKGTKEISSDCYELMLSTDEKTGQSYQEAAIARAKRNELFHQGVYASKSESSTTVFELVELLNQYL